MKTSTMMASLKKKKTKKSFEEESYEYEHPSDRDNDPNNDTVKTKTRITEKTPPLEITSQKKLLKMRTSSNQKRYKQIKMREKKNQEI